MRRPEGRKRAGSAWRQQAVSAGWVKDRDGKRLTQQNTARPFSRGEGAEHCGRRWKASSPHTCTHTQVRLRKHMNCRHAACTHACMSDSMDHDVSHAAAARPGRAHQDERVRPGRRQVILHHLRHKCRVSYAPQHLLKFLARAQPLTLAYLRRHVAHAAAPARALRLIHDIVHLQGIDAAVARSRLLLRARTCRP